MPSPNLSLNDHYKEALLQYDFKYFLDKDIEENKYSEEDVRLLHSSYTETLERLRKERMRNPKQYHYWLEGKVRLMFEGSGFLPGFFGLDGWTRGRTILDFESFGENGAMFTLWQKYERRKFKRRKVWEYLTKTGALLAIILTVIKIWEMVIE
jgi:hypothetical protein